MSTTTADDAQRAGGAEAGRYLTFTLNGEAYALDIFHITEIIEYRSLTAVPMAPDFVRGVINLRGRAVPVVDLGIRFGQGATAVARRTSIIIVHSSDAADGQDIGILVDMVNKVVGFGAGDIEPTPSFGTGIQPEFISGMARRENDFLIVLDLDRVLSPDEIAELSRGGRESPDESGTARTP
ncbi:chemotaxis protein CheW [Dactylosporangium fulvum]|uniref:Chemotaxis protein CheW n=1 Tax=Dactylosporangium fulvum TaxID=53359 RepID=A0ABY5W9J6_9ACTN|nr:chemotaxis protein CheW [Dactylosporangium fulvum]UWP86232.1 chemotaxis protein CheW [Dactylosporangium fulvum]